MSWTIRIDESCIKDLQKLDKYSQKIVINYLNNKVAKLIDPKQLGKPLRKNLKGY